jgi:ABC-type nitrate/sulfonate/bicarbonate transport system substrate-binding protein
MKLAIPDLVSPSYFPAVAAVQLGCFTAEGLDVELEPLFPVDKAYAALRDGSIDFVGGSAHAALSAFPEWDGVRLLCAQAQGMYWFLVMHADLGGVRGDVSVVKGRNIGAAPWVDMGLRGVLEAEGVDIERDNVTIGPVPRTEGAGTNFGVMAARALEERKIDGFWANGMGAEVAVRRGFGTVVLDIRRGDGPKSAFDFTFSAIAVTERMIIERPPVAAAGRRAIMRAQAALRERPDCATEIGRVLFPPEEAALIAELVRRDAPYYDPLITRATVSGMNAFARKCGILMGDVSFEKIVYEEQMP